MIANKLFQQFLDQMEAKVCIMGQFCTHEVMCACSLVIGYNYVTGSEKMGNFMQNTNFYHFLNYHHTKAFRALGFPTELQTL